MQGDVHCEKRKGRRKDSRHRGCCRGGGGGGRRRKEEDGRGGRECGRERMWPAREEGNAAHSGMEGDREDVLRCRRCKHLSVTLPCWR